jgi:starch phosphorylase
MARKANGVSKLHGEVSRKMWGGHQGICEITHVTNAQNKIYWADAELEKLRTKGDEKGIAKRKQAMKKPLFDAVADQCGKLFDPQVLTIVWARRFAAYKRPDLLPNFKQEFDKLMRNTKYPIQFIWAGKPYPKDFGAINTFNNLVYLSHLYPNIAVLTGHELGLSKTLKHGADLWLNTPIVPREASGTSGMTAAMNAGINVSTDDGWICEFAKHGQNAFVVQPAAPANANDFERDHYDAINLFKILQEQILPMYYDQKADWNKLVINSMNDVDAFFESGRMATEYYQKVY